MTRAQRERELARWYDAEVARRSRRDLPALRVDGRERFVAMLAAEARDDVLEVGCGPGRDGIAFTGAGVRWTGVDLAPRSVDACRAHGLDAHVAPLHALPFADATFASGWAMSVLVHVADADVDGALAEIVRVLAPGAPLAIGTWGAAEPSEGPVEADGLPPRFFAVRTDDAWRTVVERHGVVEQWATWPDPRSPWHYQWLVLRTRE